MKKRRGRKTPTNDNAPAGNLDRFLPDAESNVVSMREYARRKSEGATGGALKQLDGRIRMISAQSVRTNVELEDNASAIKKIDGSLDVLGENVRGLMRDSAKSLGMMRDLSLKLDDNDKKLNDRIDRIEKQIKELDGGGGKKKEESAGLVKTVVGMLGALGVVGAGAVGAGLSSLMKSVFGDDVFGDGKKDAQPVDAKTAEPPPIPEEHRYTTPDNTVLDKREIKRRVNEKVQQQTKPDEQPTRELVEKITDEVVQELKAAAAKNRPAKSDDKPDMMKTILDAIKKLGSGSGTSHAGPKGAPAAGGLNVSINKPIQPAPSPTAAPDTAAEGAPLFWEKNVARPGQGLLPDMPSVKPSGGVSGGGGGGSTGGGAAPQAVPQGTSGGGGPSSGSAGNMAMLNDAMDEMNFMGESQRAGLAAITVGESNFTSISENMNYSAPRAREIFKFEPPGGWESIAAQGEQAVAEAVYGYRSLNPAARGLGNDQPGDGWKYRGRGFIQITGKANYADIGRAIGVDLVSNPDALLDPKVAAKAAVVYMQKRGSPADFESQLKAVGGSSDAYAKKRTAYKKFMEEGTFKPGAGKSGQQTAAAGGGGGSGPDATPVSTAPATSTPGATGESGGAVPQAVPQGVAGGSGATSATVTAPQVAPQSAATGGGAQSAAVPQGAPGGGGVAPQAVPQGAGGSASLPPNVAKEGPHVDMSNVNSELMSKFAAAAQEYGKPVRINSAFRSEQYQAELWARGNIFHEPGISMPAAPKQAMKVTISRGPNAGRTVDVPGGGGGGGPHTHGIALDVSPGYGEDPAWMTILQKHGITFPFGSRDKPHIQLQGSSASSGDTGTPPTGASPQGVPGGMAGGGGYSGLLPQAVGTNQPQITGSRAQFPGQIGSIAGAPGMGPLAGILGALPPVNIPGIPGIGGGILGDVAGMATGFVSGMVGNAIGGLIGGAMGPGGFGGGTIGGGLFGGGRTMAPPMAPQIPGPPQSGGDGIGGILGSLVSMISGLAGSGGAAGNVGNIAAAINETTANRNVRAPNPAFPTDYQQNNNVPAAMPSSTLLRELFDLNISPGYNPVGYAFGR